eukprot:3852360-Rhodomonas_salina.1
MVPGYPGTRYPGTPGTPVRAPPSRAGTAALIRPPQDDDDDAAGCTVTPRLSHNTREPRSLRQSQPEPRAGH